MKANLFFIIAAIIFVICFFMFLYQIEKQVAPEVNNPEYEREIIDNNTSGERLETKPPEKINQ